MSLNGKGNVPTSLLTDIKTNGINANTTLTTINEEQSGNKSINWRLQTSSKFGVVGMTSTRHVITSAQFWANEYGIPAGASSNIDLSLPTSAVILGIASTSANDTNTAGTGARVVQITGLDANYVEQIEAIALNGFTKVNSLNTYIAVNQMLVVVSGSTGWNEGTIYCGSNANTFTAAGEPDTDVYRTIGLDVRTNALKGIGISNNATYTIAAGQIACPLNFKCATDATSTKPLLIRGIVKPFGLGELTVGNLTFSGSREFTFDGFACLPEKSSMIIRSKADGTSIDSSVLYWEWNTLNS